MNAQDVMKMIQENEVRFVDLRFTDTRGKEHHVGLPVSAFEEEHFEHGHPFDGSSLAGWKGIQASDMILMPEPSSAYIDPFFDETTLVITCDVIEPSDGKGFDRDPRSLAKRAEAYLKTTGIGDNNCFNRDSQRCPAQGTLPTLYGESALSSSSVQRAPSSNRPCTYAPSSGYVPCTIASAARYIRVTWVSRAIESNGK